MNDSQGTINNDYLSTEYILNEINKLKKEASRNYWRMDVDVQRGSGGITYNFIYTEFTNLYSNITNILVRIIPQSISSIAEPSILLSAHYDTAVGAHGAGDDGAAVAILLESLSVFVHHSSKEYKHPILFIWNNSEESYLQGAHLFASQHPWANLCPVFINIEGIATGGPAMLFQNGPTNKWIMDIYKKTTTHPFSLVLSRDLFRFSIIPADTDFRIYTKHPLAINHYEYYRQGLDFVFFENGFVYHSINDDFDHLTKGQLQYMGDLIVHLTKNIVNHHSFPYGYDYTLFTQKEDSYHINVKKNKYMIHYNQNIHENVDYNKRKAYSNTNNDDSIHFDILGLLFINYNENVFYHLIQISFFLSLFHIYNIQLPHLFRGVLNIILSSLSGLIMGLFIAFLNVFIFQKYLYWYSSLFSGLFTYGPIMIITSILMYLHLEKPIQSETIYQSFYRYLHYQLFFSLLIAFLCSLFNLTSAYICLFFIIPPGLCILYIYFIRYVKRSVINIYICFFVGVLLPSLYFGYSGKQLLQIAIPFAGRSGPLNPFLVESLIVVVIFVLCLNFTIPLFPYLCTFHITFHSILIYLVLALLTLMLAPQPFSADHPRRVYIQYTSEFEPIPLVSTSYVYNHDYLYKNKPVQNISHSLRKMNQYHCEHYIYISPTDSYKQKQLLHDLSISHKQLISLSPIDWLSHLPVGIFYKGYKYKVYQDSKAIELTRNPVLQYSVPFIEIVYDKHCTLNQCYIHKTPWRRNMTLHFNTAITGVVVFTIDSSTIVSHNASLSTLHKEKQFGKDLYIFRHSGGFNITDFYLNFVFSENTRIEIRYYINYNANNIHDHLLEFEEEMQTLIDAQKNNKQLLVYPFYGITQSYSISPYLTHHST